jgi:hypothetical protein
MYKENDYAAILAKSTEWPKYGNPLAFAKILKFLTEKQYIPSQVSLNRAIRELGLRRIDGKTSADDAREARAAAQANLDAVVSEIQRTPLTPEFVNEVASLGQLNLSCRYFADSIDGELFRIRYDRACKEFGFRPAQRFASVAAEQEASEALELTAAEYNAMPSHLVAQKMRTDLKFKQAVYLLLASGRIR